MVVEMKKKDAKLQVYYYNFARLYLYAYIWILTQNIVDSMFILSGYFLSFISERILEQTE